MKLYDVSYNLKTQDILTESWSTLTENQRTYLNKAEHELWPLMEQLTKAFEAELTPTQIQSIFKGAEDHAMASGGHKSALGKAGQVAKLPIDIMKAVNAKVNELGRMAQQSGPVKNMDAKFEELKKKIGTSDGKIVQGIKVVSDWAKANPGKATLAVAILTAVAAFATGPAGGAAAGFLLRSTKDLLKGEKLSTAVGKAAKTAAIGALAGATFDAIGDKVVSNRAEMVPYENTGVTQLKFQIPQFSASSDVGSIAFGGNGTLYFPEGMFETSLIKNTIEQAQNGDFGAFNEVLKMVDTYSLEEALIRSGWETQLAKELAIEQDSAMKIIRGATDGISALAQGSVTASGTSGNKKVDPDDTKANGKSGEDFNKGGTPPTGESVDYETYLHQ